MPKKRTGTSGYKTSPNGLGQPTSTRKELEPTTQSYSNRSTGGKPKKGSSGYNK